MRKQYSGDFDAYEAKLKRVMDRLGVQNYQYDWTQKKGGSSCFVEMQYGGATYRFENSTEKSKECGQNLIYPSDLFAAIIYSLEGLARAIERGIFTLDMLLAGVPQLPAGSKLDSCFAAMGFSAYPETESQIKEQYRRMAKVLHPDKGGDAAAFDTLQQNYEECLRLFHSENK